jgi:transposase
LVLRFGISLENIYRQMSTETDLCKLANDGALPYKVVKRARAVWLMQLQRPAQAAACIADYAVSTVRKWYQRYLKDGIPGLKDLPRSGRPRVFGDKFKLQVTAIVCQKPAELYLPGVTHWSIKDLAMMLPRLLNFRSISTESVRKILQEHRLKPHRIEYYLTRTDPDFFSKAERILNIYESPPADGLVLSVDERTAIQVLERLYPRLPLKPGYHEKVEFHYKRHTPFSLIAGLCIQSGQVFGRCYQRHTQYQFLDFMQALAQFYRDIRLYVILDNLKTHKTQLIKNWLTEQKGRIEFIFTPFHGSWLNQIEIWFGILEKKCLKRMDVSSTEAGYNHTLNYIDTWNNYYAKPFNWKFTANDLKDMLSQEPIKLPS